MKKEENKFVNIHKCSLLDDYKSLYVMKNYGPTCYRYNLLGSARTRSSFISPSTRQISF